jgi:transposase
VSLSQSCPCASCVPGQIAGLLLPHLASVVAERAWEAAGRVFVLVRAAAAQAACPWCGVLSGRVHSGYSRRLRDAAAGGREVVIWLSVRRLFCGCPDCPAVTFAEQPAGLAGRYARRTPPLAAALAATAAALGGLAGAALAARLAMPAGRDSMIRLVMAVPVPEPERSPEILGVDDFALRKGRHYGTVLIDMETGGVIGLLPDREAATFRDWLEEHPGAAVICRDRGGAYAEGAREGAPDAVQVADRWHLWHNLAEHTVKEAARHLGCLKDPGPDPEPEPEPDPEPRAGEPGLAARTRRRHELVQALRAEGNGVMAIMKETGLAKGTVRRFYHAAAAEELLPAEPAARPSLLQEHEAYLRQRLGQGTASARRLHAEVTARGYAGSYGTVSKYLRQFREPRTTSPRDPAGPRASQVARCLLRRPGSLTGEEEALLARARERCPELGALHGHIRAFAQVMEDRAGQAGLDGWLTAAEASGLPSLKSFAHGIRTDHAAVTSGLTLPWNSGKVEGTVCKLKLLKRQMYGQASLALLQQRLKLT